MYVHWYILLPYILAWHTMEMEMIRLSIKVDNPRWFPPDFFFLPRHWKWTVNSHICSDIRGGGRTLCFRQGPHAALDWLRALYETELTCMWMPSLLTCSLIALSPITPLISFSFLRCLTSIPQGGQNKFQDCVSYCKCVGKAGPSTSKGHLAAYPAWSVPFCE